MYPSFQSERIDLLDTPQLGDFGQVEHAKGIFKFLKASPTIGSSYKKAHEFFLSSGKSFVMLPIGEASIEDVDLIADLVSWRKEARFRGDGAVTVAGTATWLRKSVLENSDRILWLIVDSSGKRHGHLGLWIRYGKYFELDNVVKAAESDEKGLFSSAVRELGIWANEYLGLRELPLRVDKDNRHARGFYRNLGFEEVSHTNVPSDYLESEETHWVHMSVDTEAWAESSYEETAKGAYLTAGPSIGAVEKSLVADAVAGGWNSHHSDYLSAFTKTFNEYAGCDFSIATDSCTSALHLALWSLGIGPGDEVIVPNVTWVATATAVRYVGATPVFADIEPATWCISVQSVEELITEKTKAIIPVHLYGFIADLVSLSELCKRHGLFMVQDAAPAIGGIINGRSITDFGDFTCFSFQGAKLLVTGEGGLLTTNKPELHEKARRIASYGRVPDSFWLESFGRKMQMSNVTASLGLAQLYSVERQVAKKRLIRDWYLEEFEIEPGIGMQVEVAGSRSICWMSSVIWGDISVHANDLKISLREKGIDTRNVFPAISTYPFWEERYVSKKEVSELVHRSALNLPSGVRLAEGTVRRIARSVVESIRSSAKV